MRDITFEHVLVIT